jgi:hypothetical protein
VANESQRANLTGQIRTIQIITAALTAGALMFFLIVVAMGLGNAPAQAATPFITYVALGFTVMNLGVRQFVPSAVADAARRKLVEERRQSGRPARYANVATAEVIDRATDANRLCGVYQTKTIISAAIVEGAAFLAMVAYQIEHWWPGLALAIALIVGLALHIPSQSRVEHWVEDQLRLAEQETQLGG